MRACVCVCVCVPSIKKEKVIFHSQSAVWFADGQHRLLGSDCPKSSGISVSLKISGFVTSTSPRPKKPQVEAIQVHVSNQQKAGVEGGWGGGWESF